MQAVEADVKSRKSVQGTGAEGHGEFSTLGSWDRESKDEKNIAYPKMTKYSETLVQRKTVWCVCVGEQKIKTKQALNSRTSEAG